MTELGSSVGTSLLGHPAFEVPHALANNQEIEIWVCDLLCWCVCLHPLLCVVVYGQGQCQPQVCGWPTEIEIGFVKSTTPSGQVKLGY